MELCPECTADSEKNAVEACPSCGGEPKAAPAAQEEGFVPSKKLIACSFSAVVALGVAIKLLAPVMGW